MKAIKDIFTSIFGVFKNIFIFIVLLAVIFLRSISTPATRISRRRIMRIIRRKFPAYVFESLTTLYSDWSSTIRETDKYNKATLARAVISSSEEKRTLHLKLRYRMWHITHDAPDGGRNVPDGEYYMEDNVAAVGKRIDINESVKHSWVIPDENGELYHKVGTDENWYYSYHYIRNIYKTGDGGVYMLNCKTFEWERTDLAYSYIDYYGNCTKIPREKAEELIAARKRQLAETREK